MKTIDETDEIAEDERSRDGRPRYTAEVRELAERQHGMIARWQCIRIGLTNGQVNRRIENERFVPVRRGVYSLGHRPVGNYGKWMSAVLSCGPDAVLSHRSAAALWGILKWNGPVEVISPYSGKRRQERLDPTHLTPPAVRRPSTWRYDTDCTEVNGIPVTSIARTFIDLAAVLDEDRLSVALNEATRRELVNINEMRAAVASARGRKGIGNLRKLLAKWHPEAVLTRSELENRFLDFLRRYGFPKPAVNQNVAGYEVDFYWEMVELIVELDGREFHDTDRGFEVDRDRSAQLELSGRRVLRLTWSMIVHDPHHTAAKLRAYFRLALETMPEPEWKREQREAGY